MGEGVGEEMEPPTFSWPWILSGVLFLQMLAIFIALRQRNRLEIGPGGRLILLTLLLAYFKAWRNQKKPFVNFLNNKKKNKKKVYLNLVPNIESNREKINLTFLYRWEKYSIESNDRLKLSILLESV